MRRMVFAVFVGFAMTALPVITQAAGGHDGLTCTGCHALHTAKGGNLIFAVDPNKKDINPRTKQPYSGITALCLGCHETEEKGGQEIKPINGHISHPYGLASVNSKVAHVPAESLRDGKFECVGCHDPHPSNTNYKYLRIDTIGGAKMDVFCAACHPMKADPKSAAAAKTRMFSSMDENASPASASAEAPTAAAQSSGKKKP